MRNSSARRRTQDPEKPKERETRRPHLDNITSYYSNNTQFALTPWDITMDFGTVAEATDRYVVVHDSIRIIMSLQHAKVFSKLLRDNIEIYEKRFGRIPIPEQVGQASEASAESKPTSEEATEAPTP